MSEANVIFTLDGVNLTIQCTKEDKMKEICKSYSNKINKNIDSLIFLYEGNKVNFELSFKEQANNIDRNNNQMKILVSECDEKNESVCCLKNVNLFGILNQYFFLDYSFLIWMKKLN